MRWQMITIDGGRRHEAESLIKSIEGGCAICSKGSVGLTVNGRRFCLRARQLFLYPPYAKIDAGEVSDDFECVLFDVDHQFLLSTLKSVVWSDSLHLIDANPIASLTDGYFDRLQRLIGFLMSEPLEGDPRLESLAADCMKQAMTYEVLATFTARAEREQPSKSSKDAVVLEFQAMLKDECRTHRDVRFYASRLGLSPRYFSTVIKEMTGYPASYWIVQAVIVEAQHLMLDYSISIKEITYRLNFSAQTFFSRWYKLYTGETPTRFRQRNKLISKK